MTGKVWTSQEEVELRTLVDANISNKLDAEDQSQHMFDSPEKILKKTISPQELPADEESIRQKLQLYNAL